MDNLPPVVISIEAPDSLEAVNSLAVLQATVDNPNGLQHNIEHVIFFSIKPDKTVANSGNPFFLFDDGGTIFHGGVLSGDTEEGNGIYTITIIVPPGTVKGGYIFKFRAVDKSGLESEFFEWPVVVF